MRHIGPQVSLSCAPSRGFTQPAVPKCGKHLCKGNTALRRGDDSHEHSESNHASAFPRGCCPSCDMCCVLLCFHVCHSRVHNNKDPEISMTVSLLQEYLADCCDTSARKSHFHVRPREGFTQPAVPKCGKHLWKGQTALRRGDDPHGHSESNHASAFPGGCCPSCDLWCVLLCLHVCHSRVQTNKDPEISMTVSLLQEYLADCCDTSARKSHFHVRPREGSLNLRFLSVASTYGKAKPLSAEATIRMSIQRAIMQVLFLAVAVQVVIFGVSCCVFTSATPESITTKPPKSL